MYRKNLIISSLAALALVPVAGRAQAREEREKRAEQEERSRRDATRFAYSFGFEDRDRPRLGISTESSGMRDTLGLLVSDVTEDGPASKAGIHEGDRIQSVNGVNLRLAREDAGEDDMEGIATRRLIRTLGKLKIGDEVDLRVWSDGSVKNVKVKTVSIEDLEGRRYSQASYGFDSDRASLGIGLGSSGSRRDTLGILVSSVVDDGPAAKAGLIEGDRIQSINGVDLRVPGEDAGDWAMSSSRVRRLTREMEKAKPGDEVELRVYSGGSVKSVRIKTVSASEIPQREGFFFGDMPGGVMAFPRGQLIRPKVITPMTPGMMRYRVSPQEEGLVRQRLEEALPKIAPALQRKLRSAVTI